MTASAIAPVSLDLWRRDAAAFAAGLGESVEQSGFAIVEDHGLDQAGIDAALDSAKSFFALPDAIKRRYHVPGGAGQRGYTAFGVETAKGANASDLKEFWHVGRELSLGHPLQPYMPPNLWPSEISGFHKAQTWLYHALETLGGIILQALALRLGLARAWFAPAVADGNSVLRLLHYPPLAPGAGSAIRAGAHEDINAITLLLGAEEAGLQILGRDGRWRDINPPPGAVVVNIGDMLSRLTNDILPSTTHRVVNPDPGRAGVARYSTPFFLHFRPDFTIATLPSCVSAQRPDRYPTAITADDFLRQRLEEIRLV